MRNLNEKIIHLLIRIPKKKNLTTFVDPDNT